uniref:Uncharacterized protein n=1 Tax=Oryza brachyantha TaxID=4533 RepID=J3LU07_ORYBR
LQFTRRVNIFSSVNFGTSMEVTKFYAKNLIPLVTFSRTVKFFFWALLLFFLWDSL